MNTASKCKRVLFVEDDLDLRESMSAYLAMAGFEVTGVGSCLESYAALTGSNFCVAVVDVSLPDQSGLVLAEFLRANTDIKIIILTALERIDDRLRGYEAGAHNYLVKPVDARELLAAITSLAQSDHDDHEKPAAGELSGNVWRLTRQTWCLRAPDGTSIPLTSLELRLLELLASAPGEVVIRDNLLHGLYNRADEHSGRALDSLVRRLRAKISSSGHTSPIKTAHSVGYCFSATVSIA